MYMYFGMLGMLTNTYKLVSFVPTVPEHSVGVVYYFTIMKCYIVNVPLTSIVVGSLTTPKGSCPNPRNRDLPFYGQRDLADVITLRTLRRRPCPRYLARPRPIPRVLHLRESLRGVVVGSQDEKNGQRQAMLLALR